MSKLTQAQRSYWADKTPEERSREMRRRMRKWKPEAKAKFLKKKKIAKTPPKQLVYAQRHAAKKRGLPLPPLPPPSGEKAA